VQHSTAAPALQWKASLLGNQILIQYFVVLRVLGYTATSAIYPAIGPQCIPPPSRTCQRGASTVGVDRVRYSQRMQVGSVLEFAPLLLDCLEEVQDQELTPISPWLTQADVATFPA
jgi:hypothetical protein